MPISEDILNAIQKNLSAEVSAMLQERLALADELEPQVANLLAELKKLLDLKNKADVLDRRERALGAEQTLLDQNRMDFELEKAITAERLQSALARRQDIMGIITLLLGNRIIRETAQRGHAVEGPGEYGCGGSVQNVQETTETNQG